MTTSSQNYNKSDNYEEDPVTPELRRSYEEMSLRPLWEIDILPAPEHAHIWTWEKMRPIVFETAKITLPHIIERRVIEFVNPSSRAVTTCGMMSANVQALMPGEHARPHRHSMHALRFVLEGKGAETIVEGKPCLMEPGDLVLTPGWTWHEHRNHGDEPTVWVDILDIPLHGVLGTAEFQPGPIDTLAPTLSDSAFTSGGAFVPVAAYGDKPDYSQLFRYKYADAKAAVSAAPAAADGTRTVRYADPVAGGSTMPTIDCSLTEIDQGITSETARSNAATVYVVVEGEGESLIGGETIKWGPKDVFTVPPNGWASHSCVKGPARLFVASNREVYRRLGMLAEENKAD